MSKIAKKILLLGILTGTMLVSFADRGIGKKSKTKVLLNINTNSSFKSSIAINLKNGLKYKGSLLSNSQQTNSLTSTELVTYQKGNSIYIIPYKQKIIVPEIRQGYTGLKLIIKTY
ncbi:MAG: hypothetical protein ABI741_15105 [Ferruginibacter sp.]